MAKEMTEFYLQDAHSGRIEQFDEFMKRVKDCPNRMKMDYLRGLLAKEAQPYVTAARHAAYEDSKAKRKGRKKRRSEDYIAGTGTKIHEEFYNLYRSIGKWRNRRNKYKAYVVVGLRKPGYGSMRRTRGLRGAYYAIWQLFGGTSKNFEPKDFFGKADERVDDKRVIELMERYIDKQLTTWLR